MTRLIPGPLVYAGAGVAVLGLGYYFFSPKAQAKVHQGINKAEGKVRYLDGIINDGADDRLMSSLEGPRERLMSLLEGPRVRLMSSLERQRDSTTRPRAMLRML